MSSAWLAPLLRLGGAEPRRVLGLMHALRAESRGQQELQYEARGRRGMHPDAGRTFLLLVLVVLSLGVTVGAGLLRERLLLASLVVAGAQVVAALLRAGGEVVPLVLGDDDRPVLGWWPVSERELLLARGLIVGTSVLEGTLAVAAIPVLVLAIVAQPVLIVALGLAAGLLLHTIALAAVMVLFTHGLGRLLGPRRARRLAETLGTLLLVVLINVVVRSVRPWFDGMVAGSPWWLVAVPATWWAAWGALTQPSAVVLAALAASVAATGGLVVAGGRVLARGRGEQEREGRPRQRNGWDWTTPVVAWTRPWLGGRDGQALRLLLRAHLREDWRFTGSLLFLPLMMLAYLLLVRSDDLASMGTELVGLGPAASTLGLWMSLLGLSVAAAVTCSTEAAAGWLMATSVLDPGRALALQRRLVRALIPAPMLPLITLVLIWRTGLDPWQAPLVFVPAWLAFEALVVFIQSVTPTQSFGRAWRREGNEFRGFHLLVLMIWPVVMLPLLIVHDRLPWGPPVVIASQLIVWAGLRLVLRWRVAKLGVVGLSPRRP